MAKNGGDMADGSASQSPPTSPQLSDWPLRRPASRRISNPVSLRLQTITEGHGPGVPPIPARSSMRDSGSSWSLHHNDGIQPPPSRDGRRSTDRPGTAPPAYEWVPDPNPSDANLDGRIPVEGEKLAKLRRGGGYMRKSRGGTKRLFLILAVLFVVVVGLAVGLGVGLTAGRHHSDNNQQSSPAAGTNNTGPPTNGPFPLGEFSFIAALRTTSTNCTSDASTWSCPSAAYDASIQAGVSVFNWIISNTDKNYATVGSGPTSEGGIPANLSISSNDPFGIRFPNQTMTYIASSTNSTSARLTFSFVAPKGVVTTLPSTGNANVECFFNQTTLTGTLYLLAGSQYPSNGSDVSPIGPTGYSLWPYAVEITQSSPSGEGTPTCYTYNNNQVGNIVSESFTPQGASSQCVCDYRNYS